MRLLLALLPLTAALACQAPLATTPRPSTSDVPAGTSQVRLAVGESRRLGDDFTVHLVGASDSRCPSGVQCVWAGEATVVVGPSHPLMRFRPDTLTLAPTRGGQRDSMTIGPFHLRLTALDPAPRANAPASTSQTATFEVRR